MPPQTQTTTGFLSFNRRPPTIHILGTDPTIAPQLLSAYRAEAFSLHYHGLPSPTPSEKDAKAFKALLKSLADSLALGENFAIVAFGAAATLALQVAQKPWPRLCALVAYYPSLLPSPGFRYPAGLPLVLHLAGPQQAGTGGSTRAFWYRGTEAGFAEEDLEEWDQVAAELAWSRTLAVVRKGFGLSQDFELEDLVEEHRMHKWTNKNAQATMSTMVPSPSVNHVPTGTGGIGRGELMRFYRDFFLPAIPPSLTMRLVSRTCGVDRVVDELVVSLRHTQELPWLLPGVPPTNKPLSFAMVSSVGVRGGKLVSERVYWDQAGVLVQAGLLDPKAAVPPALRQKGVESLPVLPESAKKVLDEESVPSNELIAEW